MNGERNGNAREIEQAWHFFAKAPKYQLSIRLYVKMKTLTLALVVSLAVGTRAIDVVSSQAMLKPKCGYDENPTEIIRKGFDNIVKMGTRLAKQAKNSRQF